VSAAPTLSIIRSLNCELRFPGIWSRSFVHRCSHSSIRSRILLYLNLHRCISNQSRNKPFVSMPSSLLSITDIYHSPPHFLPPYFNILTPQTLTISSSQSFVARLPFDESTFRTFSTNSFPSFSIISSQFFWQHTRISLPRFPLTFSKTFSRKTIFPKHVFPKNYFPE